MRGEEGGKGKDAKEMEISAPTNFQHITHIGWDEANGFQVNNLPPEWKELFKQAGVKKKDLQDADTARAPGLLACLCRWALASGVGSLHWGLRLLLGSCCYSWAWGLLLLSGACFSCWWLA